MGLFDDYAGVQLKVGNDAMKEYDEYAVGDAVPIADGIYVGWEGFVVVHAGKILCVAETITTKWGMTASAESVLRAISGIDV
mgnify:CR=1 FL=1